MIGLTSVTFRKLTCEEIIRLAQESGAECIEWGGDVHVTDEKTAREARRGCEQAGLQTAVIIKLEAGSWMRSKSFVRSP